MGFPTCLYVLHVLLLTKGISAQTATAATTAAFGTSTQSATTAVGNSTQSAPFYPFGPDNGDTEYFFSNYFYTYGYNLGIWALNGFPFFGTTDYQIYVYPNGFLSLGQPSTSTSPTQFPSNSENDIIAPFWTAWDDPMNGVIYYRQVTSGSFLQQVTSDINQYFPQLSFTATWAFIATWNWTEPYNDYSNIEEYLDTNFQVVLVTDGNLSFTVMNYGTLSPEITQVGYETVESKNYFSVPGSFQSNITNLSFTSNVNTAGRWVFRTDYCVNNCLSLGNFYPFGPENGDTVNPSADDGNSVVLLDENFVFFGKDYDQFYVNNNGFLTFNRPWNGTYYSLFQSGVDIIAPLWSYINFNTSVVSYRQVTNGSDLERATSDINQYFPELDFTATWVSVVTWGNMTYKNISTRTSFQLVLISDGNLTFMLLNYHRIPSLILNAQAGFATADLMVYFNLIKYRPLTDLSFNTNVNVTGRWAFQTSIDYAKGPFYPFGTQNGDTLQYFSNSYGLPYYRIFQTSTNISFPFFGSTDSQINVFPNGILTLGPSSSYWGPMQFPSYSTSNIIAPFWMYLDYTQTGVLSYRQVTNGSDLQRATSDIKQYFPQLNFTATWAFVVTWNWMVYGPPTASGTTFQAVLVSNGDLSFVMMNYGNLAPTTYNVQAGYDSFYSTNYFSLPGSFQSNITDLSFTSNVNTAGRWVFRTDYCVYDCLFQENFYPFGTNNGDTVNSGVVNESSPVLLDEVFRFYTTEYSQLYVNNNGFLTFGRPWNGTYYSLFQSDIDIIAPLWNPWDSAEGGTVSYRQVTSGSDLERATSDINQYFPELDFTATWVFIVTWGNMTYSTLATDASFQLILVSDGNQSFVLNNYGRIPYAFSSWQAGFATADSMVYFNIIQYHPVTDLTFSTNVNVTGRWAFQTSINYAKGPLYPFGMTHGDYVQQLPNYYFFYYSYYYSWYYNQIQTQISFPFFGGKYYQINVHPHGLLTLGEFASLSFPTLFPLYSRYNIIAPFWMYPNSKQSITFSYRQVTNGSDLQQATSDINQYFPELNFTATWVSIVTWNWMAYGPPTANEATFQVVLVSDGNMSFVLMNYGNLNPENLTVEVGYDTLNSTNYFNMPGSFESNITNLSFTSNVNRTGRWAFRTDYCVNDCLFQEHFYPFGPDNGDTVVPPQNDSLSSSLIQLNETVPFFETAHNQLYVSSSGFLTFDRPWNQSYNYYPYYWYYPYHSYYPYYPYIQNSGHDIIAALLSNWNTMQGGVLSYRQVTSGSDLQRATSDINQYFPDFNFTASWMLILTWDQVAYNTKDTETTFQLLLISDGSMSFVLFNYGRISSLISYAQAGFNTADSAHYQSLSSSSVSDLTFKSNVGVSGRWVLQAFTNCPRAHKLFVKVKLTSVGVQLNPQEQQMIINSFLSRVPHGNTC